MPTLLLTLIQNCMLLFLKKSILWHNVLGAGQSKSVQKWGEELLVANFNPLRSHLKIEFGTVHEFRVAYFL